MQIGHIIHILFFVFNTPSIFNNTYDIVLLQIRLINYCTMAYLQSSKKIHLFSYRKRYINLLFQLADVFLLFH